MNLYSVAEASEVLGQELLKGLLVVATGQELLEGSYYLPSTPMGQILLSKWLSTLLLGSGETWLRITYWNSDPDSNPDLFYGYRRGNGDARNLLDASVYRFCISDEQKLASIIGLTMSFLWDAHIFDASGTYIVSVHNDGFLDYQTSSGPLHEEMMNAFSTLELKRLV